MTPLEALKSLMDKFYELCQETNCNEDEYQRNNLTSERAIIEKSLEALKQIKEKYEKAIKILKDKEPHINLVLSTNNVSDYNSFVFLDYALSKEEYALLKEVLE